jgi:hypothetical protein
VLIEPRDLDVMNSVLPPRVCQVNNSRERRAVSRPTGHFWATNRPERVVLVVNGALYLDAAG